jgi:2-oxoglutarate/2-oxoacid ferredoxin oxidoreductase subunit alpha
MSEKVLMAGNHALADAALVAGVKVVAGYPITPSTEVVELIAQKIPQYGGRFIQMEDEIASIGAIIGASAIGVKAMTATSGPGFSLMQELIGYAAMVELPIVIYNAQRVGPSTGGATKPQQSDIMQTKWGSHGESPRIALCPGTVQEIYDLTIEAFNLAEKYMVPVVILTDELLAHMRESVTIPDPDKVEIINRRKDAPPKEGFLPYKVDETGIPVLPPMGEGYRYNVAGMIHGENGMPNLSPEIIESCIARINDKIENNYTDIVKYEHIKNDKATIAVVSFGTPSRPAKGAVKKACENGLEAEFFRPITMWPFPVREIREIAKRVDKILVVEMNRGQVAGIIREAIEGKAEVYQYNRLDGLPITMDEIRKKVMEIGE